MNLKIQVLLFFCSIFCANSVWSAATAAHQVAGVVSSQILECQQNPRDIRIELRADSTEVSILVFSPMGYDFLPMFESPASKQGLEHMKYQTEQLKALGDRFQVKWKRQDCEIDLKSPLDMTRIQCSRAESSSPSTVSFDFFSVSTLSDHSFAGTWKSLRFRFATSVDGKWGVDSFFVSIPISESACHSISK
jgi:hypothetical protein